MMSSSFADFPEVAIDCSYCERQLKLPDEYTTRVRCHGCNTITLVRHRSPLMIRKSLPLVLLKNNPEKTMVVKLVLEVMGTLLF